MKLTFLHAMYIVVYKHLSIYILFVNVIYSVFTDKVLYVLLAYYMEENISSDILHHNYPNFIPHAASRCQARTNLKFELTLCLRQKIF